MRTCPACGYDNLIRAKRCLKCGSEAPPLPKERRLEEGRFLGKTYRFQLKNKIEKGPDSELWLAYDLKFRRQTIGLKIVDPDISAKKGAIGALQKASLHVVPHAHPNLERIHSFENDESFAFFVVEYVKGPTFLSLLKRRKTLTEPEILWATREIATGLRYLHKLRLCHGNLNLSNLMLSQKPPEDNLPTIPTARSHPHQCVKICDEVIGRIIRDIREDRKRISPSRWSVREDAKSLAGILYRLFTGETPGKIDEEVPLPSSFPEALKGIISLCLKCSPDNREMADELISLIEGNQKRKSPGRGDYGD